ncbi:MAG: ribosomal protein S18-alanine N-acetyltransferase [Pyrinomonadaceae bacterium]
MMQISEIALGDIPVIVAIADELMLSPWSAADIAAEIGRPDSLTIKLENGGQIVAFIIGRTIDDEHMGAGTAEIYNIGVASRSQGLGFGKRIFEEFRRRSREKGSRRIILEVRVSNQQAIGFYGKLQFRTIATRKDYYRDPTEDALIMQISSEPGTC